MTATAANESPSPEVRPKTAENKTFLAALATKDCLAEVLGRQGKNEEAEALLRDVLQTRETVLGQTRENPDVRRTMNNLAGTLLPDHNAEAETLFREVFEADKKTMGYEHVYTITSMNNLAEIWSRQGKQKEAEDMMRHTVELSQKVRGADHPETVDLMDNLRELLRRQGKTEEAEQMLLQRPVLRQKVVEKQKAYDEEEASLRQVLALCQTDTEKTAALRNLSGLMETKGRYSETEDLLQQLIKLSTDVNGNQDQGLQSSKRGLGVVMSRQGRYREAEEVFRALLVEENTQLD